MKRLFKVFLAFILALSTLTTFACSEKKGDEFSLYVPDGAPALSVARLLYDKSMEDSLDINVVTANEIASFVTGENPTADFCILPVNLASKQLGNGEVYQMLGSVTQGNLFLMKKENGVDITKDNLSELIGKKVGVLNLGNVPGLTFKAILTDNNIPFVQIQDEEPNPNKVNLVALANGGQVLPTFDCDYFVVAEPAATTKQNATQNKLSICASLQSLYSEKGGFPQAVLVAKKSVIASNSKLVNDLINSFTQNREWLLNSSTSSEDIVNAVKSGFIDDITPTFNANNLNKTVINNCAISFVKATDCKADVLEYLAKINAFSNNAFKTPSNEFFLI